MRQTIFLTHQLINNYFASGAIVETFEKHKNQMILQLNLFIFFVQQGITLVIEQIKIEQKETDKNI